MTQHKPVVLDYMNVMTEAVGDEHGLGRGDLERLREGARQTVQEMGRRRHEDVGFPELPKNAALAEEISQLAEELRGWCRNFVVLGIGGSALGNRAVVNALSHPMHNLLPQGHALRRGAPRIFVMDNVDPELMIGLLDVIGDELSETAFNVITKSGSTAETMSQFLWARDLLARKDDCDPRKQMILTTEPARDDPGMLRRIADRDGYRTLPIPVNVGGRYSVLSAVGLLTAAVAGVDLKELLEGAGDMDGRCSSEDYWANPAALYGAIHHLYYQRGKPMSVFMPYSNALALVSDWYCQLWAESLGKRDALDREDAFIGPTPIRAVGVTDQHSTMQLFQDGAFDKVVTLVEVEDVADETAHICPSGQCEDALDYLGRTTFNNLLAQELAATRLALTQKQRPNLTIRMNRVTPYTLGQLFMMLEHATVLCAGFLKVNAFNQPGVELGKKYTYGLLGREGSEMPEMPESSDDYTA